MGRAAMCGRTSTTHCSLPGAEAQDVLDRATSAPSIAAHAQGKEHLLLALEVARLRGVAEGARHHDERK